MLNIICNNQLTRRILSKWVESVIKKKLGCTVATKIDMIDIQNNGEDKLILKLNCELEVNEEDLLILIDG